MTKRAMLFTPSVNEPGGANKRARLLADGLTERGWRVCVIGRAGVTSRASVRKGPSSLFIEVPGYDRRGLGLVLYSAVAVPLGLLWGVRGCSFISVQLASPSSIGGLCSFLCRRPFVAFASTSGEFSEANLLSGGWPARVRRLLVGRAGAVVAQSEEAAADLRPRLPGVNVCVLPNPVKAGESQPLSSEPRVLFAGRLAAEKNLFRLLDAWRSVAAGRSGACLTVAGEGGKFRPVEDEVRAAVREDPILTETVRLPGWVDDLRSLILSASVFVLPSLTEGMSNALLEACVLGRVAVASDIPGNRAILGPDYPLLFPPEDTAALARCLAQALDDEEVRTEAVAKIASRIHRFSLESVLDSVEDLLGMGEATP